MIKPTDPLLARQLTVLYNSYLSNQIEPELLRQIVELGTQIEKNFSTFRGAIDSKKVTDNQIKDILKSETNSVWREKAWLASKQVGAAVAPGLIETEMTDSLADTIKARAIEATAVGRPGTPQEVASAVGFLCTEEAGYITGAVLHVNGGMYM